MREAFRVGEVLVDEGRVVGIAGHARGGGRVEERARHVVGAEGHHSLVADTVAAPKYRECEALTGGYYSYWSGVELPGAEIYASDRGGVLAFPTNDGKVCIAAGRARAQFAEYRADIEGTFFSILDASPEFAERVRRGKREEHWQGAADVPNFFRQPWGPGWALVGDAGYMKDPVLGFGITDAFRDAGLLARALDQVLGGGRAEAAALGEYQAQRDAAAMPVYDFTLKLAAGEMGFSDI
jgi:flavin-dependent dehydrogenase